MKFHKILIPLFLLFSNMSYSQNTDSYFTKEWQEVDSIILKDQLPRTALERINAIYKKAQEKKLPDEMIKALLYKLSLQNKVQETDANTEINEISKEIISMDNSAAKAILHSIMAQKFVDIYNRNRWRIAQRSATISFKKEDFNTWSTDDFLKAIHENFDSSLMPAIVLKNYAIQEFNAIIYQGNSRQLRPTLYDLLAHEALDYYKYPILPSTISTSAFTLNDPKVFAPVDEFISYSFPSKDTASSVLQSLQLFQQLIAFHKNDPDHNALIDVDLERLEWAKQQSTLPTKDLLFKEAIENITEKYPDEIASEEAWFLIAQMLANQSTNTSPENLPDLSLVKAKELITQRLQIQPAPGKGNSEMQDLLQTITATEVNAKIEAVNVPNQPFRMFMQYKNFNTLYGRILPKNDVEKLWKRDLPDDSAWTLISNIPFINAFSQALPQQHDYKQHSVEVKIDGLAPGKYYLLGSDTLDFNSKHKLFLVKFTVSNLACINNLHDYFVLNRDSGKPLKNVSVKFSWNEWSNSRKKYEKKLYNTQSDQNGHFQMPEINAARTFYSMDIFLKYKNDQLSFNGNDIPYYTSFDNKTKESDDQDIYDKENATIYFFSDRSIYRPGQTVYFKGIGITKNYKTLKNQILSSKDSITVYLNDANSKTIDSVKCTLNDYGSFAGKFILPQNVLTGNFSIYTKQFNRHYLNFKVEEYKRPQFNISFDTLKKAFQLNDTILVTGRATAFAGNAIDEAQVKYTVTRKTRFIYPWLFWRFPHSTSPDLQITNGVTQTDMDGNFHIPFSAIPDSSVSKNEKPVFDYEVSVTVTDKNGETHDLKTIISIGYQSLILNVQTPASTEISAFKNIQVSAENFSGEKQPINFHFKISPLEAPAKAKRERLWEVPDAFIYSQETFETYFPYDEYKNENDYHTWKTLSPVLDTTIFTQSISDISLENTTLKQGWYLIEAVTTDKNGDSVIDKKYVLLSDKNRDQIPAPQYAWSTILNDQVQPGETADMQVGSSEKNLYLIQAINHQNENLVTAQYNFLNVPSGKIKLNYTTKETDRAGVGLFYAFVKHNRFFTGGINILMPYTDKNLNITYETFRNKMEPGSKETWTIKVSGNNSDRVTAELLTTMYDASLDQFIPHSWQIPYLWPLKNMYNQWNSLNLFNTASESQNNTNRDIPYFPKNYDQLITNAGMYWFKKPFFDKANSSFEGVEMTGMVKKEAPKMSSVFDQSYNRLEVSDENKIEDSISDKPTLYQGKELIQVRRDFNETAFFFPQLHADSSGQFRFSFTMPESLTQWKWLSLAHTKDLAFGYQMENNIITQKKLMVQPNMPRFLREGDRMEFAVKISNMSDSITKGVVTLQLFDAETMQPVDGLFNNVFPEQYFSADAGKSISILFPVQIPFSYLKPVTWRFVAKANEYSDGEENTLPVLSNRILVTESLPIFVKGDTTQHFVFDKLVHNSSATLQTQSLTVEYTAYPVWYAVQALPYLAEFPYECAEQLFNRFYANSLASHLLAQHPRIKEVIQQWQADAANSQSSLLSNLQKNEALKQILLEETPWVLNAENENAQKKNLALLFDMEKMQNGMNAAIAKLEQNQMANGAFSWFKGGREDRYITQYILTGIGRLKKLLAVPESEMNTLDEISRKALTWLDAVIVDEYNEQKKNNLNKDFISTYQIQYMYMRSYFPDIPILNKTAYNFYFQQCMRTWNEQSHYMQAMIGMMLIQTNQEKFVAEKIFKSILENGIETKDRGMYWKTAPYAYYWYDAPIERQSLFIELGNEMIRYKKDPKYVAAVNEMKTWLILQKQTNNWETTKATADACFALLWNKGQSLPERSVKIKMGDIILPDTTTHKEAGSGYWQEIIKGKNVVQNMGNISVTTTSENNQDKSTGVSYGAVYWQYFEDMDKITNAETPLSLTKNLFIEKTSDAGKVLEPVNENDIVHVGDKVVLRMVLKSDRDMEYIHLKDGRASSMEPLNVLSGYRWQDGLGYYEATKDVSTDFFISHLNKGTYVFEYPVYITQKGTFSVGIATIQCMYAPEFSAHSNGIKLVVE